MFKEFSTSPVKVGGFFNFLWVPLLEEREVSACSLNPTLIKKGCKVAFCGCPSFPLFKERDSCVTAYA